MARREELGVQELDRLMRRAARKEWWSQRLHFFHQYPQYKLGGDPGFRAKAIDHFGNNRAGKRLSVIARWLGSRPKST